MADFAHMEANCPHCGESINEHGHIDGKSVAPSPGDVSLCSYCLGFGVYTPFGSIRKPTPPEQSELEVELAAELTRAKRLQDRFGLDGEMLSRSMLKGVDIDEELSAELGKPVIKVAEYVESDGNTAILDLGFGEVLREAAEDRERRRKK